MALTFLEKEAKCLLKALFLVFFNEKEAKQTNYPTFARFYDHHI